ncbi:Metaxin-3 [Echinococcus granulosus]|uniref:Metaxin-3 n=1 Tax=Echinococcus granulosus TaxID=6210 RepID=W6U974_ECHGR|nr:Metaxin-3 [Echinococcus granulosus]EUB55037.1 Metaxin-3 [Echinococcus granulosus]
MDLYVWPDGRGIESFDSDCLVVITYLRLGGCPINLKSCRNSDKSYFYRTPLLIHGSNEVTGVSKIIEYLRKENYGLEYELSDEELARLESLVTSLERRVTPACRWLIWADTSVYHSYTSLLYRSNLSYLQGLWYPRRWRDKLIQSAEFSQLTLCTNGNTKNRYRDVELTLYEGVIRCLTALSYILSDKQFFFGDKPSAIDAYLFGRLWPLLNYDCMRRQQESKICHRLINHVYQCENLLQLCCRVQRLCFPSAASTIRSSMNAQTGVDEKVGGGGGGGGGWFSSLFVSHSVPTVLPPFLVPFRDSLVFAVLVLVVLGVFGVGSGFIGFAAEDEKEDMGSRVIGAEEFNNIEIDE